RGKRTLARPILRRAVCRSLHDAQRQPALDVPGRSLLRDSKWKDSKRAVLYGRERKDGSVQPVSLFHAAKSDCVGRQIRIREVPVVESENSFVVIGPTASADDSVEPVFR